MKSKLYTITMLLAMLLAVSGLRAQPIIGFSDFFTFNTKYKITGVVSDVTTGLPIEEVQVVTLNYSSQPTDQNGIYTLFPMPGYGYQVSASAVNYETSVWSNIHLIPGSEIVELDFELTPALFTPSLTTLEPNPNSDISTVQQSGTLHRYYKIINISGPKPWPSIPVMVTGLDFSRIYQSDGDGLVDVFIHSYEIGNGLPNAQTTFTIESVNNEPLDVPIQFIGKVISQQYAKYWESKTFTKKGVSHFSVEVESGFYSTLNVESGTFPQTFSVTRQRRAGVGISTGVGAGLSVTMGDINMGGHAHAGAGLVVSGITEDSYEFPLSSYDSWEAVAQYIMIADGSFSKLDNAMIRFLTVCQNNFSSQSTLEGAYVGDRKAIDLKGQASASAQMGLLQIPLVEVAGTGNIGVEGRTTFDVRRDYTNQLNIWGIEQSGRMSSNAQAGIKFHLPPNSTFAKEMPDMFTVYNQDEKVGFRFEILRDPVSSQILEFQLTLLRRSSTNNSGFEKESRYVFSASSILTVIENISEIVQNLSKASLFNSVIKVSNTTFQLLANEMFNEAGALQGNPDIVVNVEYYVYRREFSSISSVPININVGLAAWLKLSVEFGKEDGFEEGKQRLIEKGRWINGKHYPTESFSGSIPYINYSLQQRMQEITDEVPLWLRSLIGSINFISKFMKQDNTYYIGDNGSYIVIPENSFPTGIDSLSATSWSWYGDSPSKRLNDVRSDEKLLFEGNRQRAENSFGMKYGVGGFYQFEPLDTLFLEPCLLTIKYTEDEVQDIDELSLGMYYEDKLNKRWIYIGGVVDTINKTVTASIDRLALFTLAPAMPHGSFGLNAMPASIYADSLSFTTIFSDTIFNNNVSPAFNGQLFTVNTTLGTIITPDADTTLPGIQVPVMNHKIEFQVKSNYLGGEATISARSVNGSAYAETQVVFYDTIPPQPPIMLNVFAGDKQVQVQWSQNIDADLAGYIIYYDTDTLPPYNGIHTVIGQPSPTIVGIETQRNIIGLFNDTTYYFAVSAYDFSGNESALSSFIKAKPYSDATEIDRILQNISSTNYSDTCLSAQRTITAYNFVVENDRTSKLIAGEKIQLKTGTRVLSGGHLHAFIDSSGTFCDILDDGTLHLQDISITFPSDTCFYSTKTIRVAGNNTIFTIQNGAIARLVAKENILFLDGFSVESGAYLQAFIDTTGNYCQQPESMIAVFDGAEEVIHVWPTAQEGEKEKQFFSLFPNPTPGTFTLQLKEATEAVIAVEIYSMLGECILQTQLSGQHQYEFDLSGRSGGVYLVRVVRGNEVGVEKVVKQ